MEWPAGFDPADLGSSHRAYLKLFDVRKKPYTARIATRHPARLSQKSGLPGFPGRALSASAYGFGRAERLRERDRYVDRVQDRRLRGRKRRLTMTMRRSMIVCRLAQLAHQQKAKEGSDEPLPFMHAYQPRKAAIEAIPDLKRLWKAQTTEALEQALDQAQTAILDALQSDDMRVRIIAASLMLKTRAARQRGWT